MIKVWFLMALMAYPNINAIHYKGYGGFNEKEECEKSRPIIEDIMVNVEINKGTPSFYIETFCMEMHAFPSQWGAPRKGDEVNPAEFGV